MAALVRPPFYVNRRDLPHTINFNGSFPTHGITHVDGWHELLSIRSFVVKGLLMDCIKLARKLPCKDYTVPIDGAVLINQGE